MSIPFRGHAAGLLAFLSLLLIAAEPPVASELSTAAVPPSHVREHLLTGAREPCANYNALRQPLFGDFHVHTAFSFDARSQDTRNTPVDAYRFAQGASMGIQPYDGDGQAQRTIRLDRPLDFTAVTDHSEFLGEVRICHTPGAEGYWHPACVASRWIPESGFLLFGGFGLAGKQRWGFCGEDKEHCLSTSDSVWREVQQAATDAYDLSADCRFTSFNAYEWTASVGSGQNLHHNVIFRNHKVPERPLSWIESPSQVTLWDYLDRECVGAVPGCDAVVIPHNSNLSGGLMFETARVQDVTVPAGEVSATEAARRARWNPLFEMMQHKGSSECDSRLPAWSEDEYCNFEKLGYDRFGGKDSSAPGGSFVGFLLSEVLPKLSDSVPAPETLPPTEQNFVRYALKQGLRQQQQLGVNSFKFGFVSSTDTHIAAPGLAMEKGHPGHGGAGMGSADGNTLSLPDDLEYGPGGLAVLYAEENTREALFAAMQRREAYATSGTRPTLRFFGGWDYSEDLCDAPDQIARGYAGGVPMGGDLPPPGRAPDAPRFLVSAQRDLGTEAYPGSALQRIQVIKGWYDQGELHEAVLDVAGGDNGAAVDINTCRQTGAGHESLCSVWEDPEFDPDAPAFYYTRVLENPSCRWSQHICVDAGVRCDAPETIAPGMENCCAETHQKIIQERAWSSPIWYTPAQPQTNAMIDKE